MTDLPPLPIRIWSSTGKRRIARIQERVTYLEHKCEIKDAGHLVAELRAMQWALETLQRLSRADHWKAEALLEEHKPWEDKNDAD